MSYGSYNTQSEAVHNLLRAFSLRGDTLQAETAGSLFAYSGVSRTAVGREVAKFTAKLKSRDARFATVFTRTIDSLRTSTSIQNVDAFVEVLVKCRVQHVCYAKLSRERAETRDDGPRSPHFNRRSASRGKLSRIDRAEAFGSSNELHLDTPRAHTLSQARSTPTFARNQLFSITPTSYQRSDVASCNGSSSVKRMDSTPYRRPLSARMGTAPSVPERALCMELCGALQGLEGSYFRKDSRGYLRVMDSCALSQAQRSLVESMLSASHLHADVARVPPHHGDDLLAEAFLLESQSILEEYIHDVGDIPVHSRPLSLLRILPVVEVWRDRLTILQRLHSLRHESGTRLIEFIYMVFSPVRENFVVDKIMKCCAGVLCRSVSRWLSGFELTDCDSQMIVPCSSTGYRLVWIPPFFPKWVAEYILKIGKAWRSLDVRKSSKNLDSARAIISSQLDARCFYFQGERYKMEQVVRDTCRLVCGSVVHSLVEEHHLVDHLDAAHCFLLLHDAQFSYLLYRQFCDCTHGLRSKLSQRDASHALLAAASASATAQRFSFRPNFDTLPSVNDSPNTSSRLQFVQPLRPVYRPGGPVGDVFRDTENRYESLFHFVWPVEMCLLMTSENVTVIMQMGARSSRRISKEATISLRLLSMLLSTCERVLLRIRVYIANVVDQAFMHLRLSIDDAIDLDGIIDAHMKYLDGLTSAFFLNNESQDIFGLIMTVLQISHDLSRHCLDLTAEAQGHVQNNKEKDSPTFTKTTQLLVVHAKLKTTLAGLHSRVSDLNKRRSNPALNILLSVLDYT